ncbi:MAG: hypothetical protein HY453_00610 [Parcubacteria group bacterium]|nr:hypothetical protein [Parcubacteria group bacterium]
MLINFLLIISAILLIIFLIIFVAGYFTPEKYHCSVQGAVNVPQNDLWIFLNDIGSFPKNRPEIDSISMLGKNAKNLPTWKIISKDGRFIVCEWLERTPQAALILSVKESSYGITGLWKYELHFENGNTLVRLTEDSVSKNIWYRGLQRILGSDLHIRHELSFLQKHFLAQH